MSFGFSVGDIVLLGQLAYRLYSALNEDNRPACKELSNALFGLRCALDHLGRQAEQSKAISRGVGNGIEQMYRDLDTLIHNCAATLQELDTRLAEYSDEPESNESLTEETADTGAPASKQALLVKIKRRAQINWKKMKWSSNQQFLVDSRAKLQTHTEAINIVLNTFMWSASQRIETTGDESTKQLRRVEEQAERSNTALLSLVREIHASLLAPGVTAESSPESLPLRSLGQSQLVSSCAQRMVQKPEAVKAVSLGTSTIQTVSPTSGRPDSIPSGPPEFQGLNDERYSIGHRDFERFGQLNSVWLIPNEHSDGTTQQPPAFSELTRKLKRMADRPRRGSHCEPVIDSALVSAWTEGLEASAKKWKVHPTQQKSEMRSRVSEAQFLLVTLNGVVSAVDGLCRSKLLKTMTEAGIVQTLGDLRRTLNSVIVRKEIETFEEELEDQGLL